MQKTQSSKSFVQPISNDHASAHESSKAHSFTNKTARPHLEADQPLEDFQGSIWQQAETALGAQVLFVASRFKKDLEYMHQLAACSDPTEFAAHTEEFLSEMAKDYTLHSAGQFETLQDQLGTGIAAAERMSEIAALSLQDTKTTS